MHLILQYSIPIFVFILLCLSMYMITPDTNEEKNKLSNILIRNVLPSFSVALLTYIIVKNKTDISSEKLMTGNYFD